VLSRCSGLYQQDRARDIVNAIRIRQGCWRKHYLLAHQSLWWWFLGLTRPWSGRTKLWRWPVFSLQPAAAARQERPVPSNSTQSSHCHWRSGTGYARIFLFFLGSLGRTHERLPCGLQWRKFVELFKKRDSRFYWYDFKLRGKRYRSSTKETNQKRAGKVAALRLSQAMGGTGPLDRKASSLQEFSTRFLSWVESATLAGQSKAYY